MASLTIRVTTGDTPVSMAPEPYACYSAPYGLIGFFSDIVSCYMIACLAMSRTPLYPKRRIKNYRMMGIIGAGWILLPTIVNFGNIVNCARSGMWPLILVAVGKILGIFFGIGLIAHASQFGTKDTATGSGEAGDTGGARDATSEANLEAGGSDAANPRRYWDAAVQVGDGLTHLLVDYLPTYSEFDPLIEFSELTDARSAGLDSIGTESELAESTRHPIKLDEDQEGASAESSHTQSTDMPVEDETDKPKSSVSSASSSPEISHSEAAQTLSEVENPPEETRNGTTSQPQSNATKASEDIGVVGGTILTLIILSFLACILTGNIVLAVRSGKKSPWIIGLIFLILFLSWFSFVLFTTWKELSKAMKKEWNMMRACKTANVQGAAYAVFVLMGLLIILYSDLNLGVLSGRVTGVVTDSNKDMIGYWVYLGASKLPLLCF